MEILDVYDVHSNKLNKTTVRGNLELIEGEEFIKIVTVWFRSGIRYLIQLVSEEKGSVLYNTLIRWRIRFWRNSPKMTPQVPLARKEVHYEAGFEATLFRTAGLGAGTDAEYSHTGRAPVRRGH